MEPSQNHLKNSSLPPKANTQGSESKSGPQNLHAEDYEETKEGFPPPANDFGDKIKPCDPHSPSDLPISTNFFQVYLTWHIRQGDIETIQSTL